MGGAGVTIQVRGRGEGLVNYRQCKERITSEVFIGNRVLIGTGCSFHLPVSLFCWTVRYFNCSRLLFSWRWEYNSIIGMTFDFGVFTER